MRREYFYRSILSLFGIALSLSLISSCSSLRSKKSADSNEALDVKAQTAVAKTVEDERRAPQIQSEMNALFFRGKKLKPGGLDAFSRERVAELDVQVKESKSEAIAYYVENRKFFERVEDAGGGFRVVPNGKRLVPYLKTRAGRKKVFQMDLVRVREMTANPCFSALEDCGEDASDGEENTALLDEWTRKYPDKEFRGDREKVLHAYLAALSAYQRKFEKRIKPDPKAKEENSRKYRSGKEAVLFIGTHRRGIESLLGE